MTTTLTRKAARRRYAIVAIAIPLLLHVAVLIVQLALVPLLPDPAASHWGFSGTPDGFSAPWQLPLVTTGTGIFVTLLVALAPYLADAAPEQLVRGGHMSYRLLGAIVWAETGFILTLALATFVPQVGLDDAGDAHLPGWWMLVGLGIGAALALVAWRSIPEPPRDGSESAEPASPIPLGESEQAVWLKTVSMSRRGLLLLALLVGAGLIVNVVVAVSQLSTGAVDAGLLLSIGVLVLVVVLVAANTVFRVRIDHTGLEVRASVGWPRVRIVRERIRSAEAVYVNPMGEYGGWGWRYGLSSGWGVVLRAGEALRVVRTNGKVFTVTVDDAETGAALLNGLIARAAGEARPSETIATHGDPGDTKQDDTIEDDTKETNR